MGKYQLTVQVPCRIPQDKRLIILRVQREFIVTAFLSCALFSDTRVRCSSYRGWQWMLRARKTRWRKELTHESTWCTATSWAVRWRCGTRSLCYWTHHNKEPLLVSAYCRYKYSKSGGKYFPFLRYVAFYVYVSSLFFKLQVKIVGRVA